VDRVDQSLVFCVVFCRSLFVLLSFFIWSLRCLSFDLRLLITHLVSSDFLKLELTLFYDSRIVCISPYAAYSSHTTFQQALMRYNLTFSSFYTHHLTLVIINNRQICHVNPMICDVSGMLIQ